MDRLRQFLMTDSIKGSFTPSHPSSTRRVTTGEDKTNLTLGSLAIELSETHKPIGSLFKSCVHSTHDEPITNGN